MEGVNKRYRFKFRQKFLLSAQYTNQHAVMSYVKYIKENAAKQQKKNK